jgi:integrase/recombinase XerD
MSTLPASPCSVFVSPLASRLVQFLAQKHAMGYRYREEGRALRELDRFLSTRLSADDPLVTLEIVHDYVARRGTESETTRAHRLTLMREVCRFLRLEEGRTAVPDRRCLRIVRLRFVPRVLSRDEGKRFLQACAELPQGRTSPVRDAVLGTALRLLYLAGLRAGELLRLTQADVDFDAGTLQIRHSKFDKSRVVPIAPDLVQRLARCRTLATQHFGSRLPDTPLFPSPRGGRYSITALREAFHQTLKTAGIARKSGNRHIRLHDLRHSFAVLRLLLWCEQNVDLGAKLPLLATYLGHVGLASSQRYLQLTRDLMGEITRRHQARFGYLISERGR